MDNNVYKALIDAADRYIKSTRYPDLSVVCAILGINLPNNTNSYSVNLTSEGISIYEKR